MNINPLSSATNLITSAQQKADTAAQTIARMPIQDQEVGGSGEAFKANDVFKPVLSLKEAEFETSAAVKVIQADKEMQETIGSLFDEKA
ncbi:hypothetical protein [Methylomonas rapida]|jgi:hypothetical protein|uniref:Flagellar basal-body/hook protein C-terminal domain-containing protein n=1 Tax=Methylomonas rapida TaxID=2963939 RepID=A0ABY7GGY8_9GAMM|nr:hypothetical protein [Methylomonas rapida]WAR44525.1 hypothetical protein NM686_019580 [Methylomonas rapida]